MRTDPSRASLQIYGVPISVHTRKVLLAARLKSIPYVSVPVVPIIPDNPPPNWRSISPTGLIPAIDDGGYVLADSTAIVVYLERKVPEPALLPANAQERGTASFLDSWAGSELFRRVMHPLFHETVVGPKLGGTAPDRAVIDTVLDERVPEAFGYLEGRAPQAFLVGETLSIADLAVVSNLILFHYLGHRIDARRYPRLAAYFRRQLDSPLFAAALEEERAFADRFGLDRGFLA